MEIENSFYSCISHSRRSRPSDKLGGPSHPDPEIRGEGGRCQKNFFSALRVSARSHTLSLYLFFIPFHSRPAHSFLWYTSPFKTFKFIIWRNINKCYLLKILFCIFLALLIFLFVYSIPVSDLVFKELYSGLQFTL